MKIDYSQKYKSNIWKYYFTSLLGGFAFFYNAIDTLYYRYWELQFEQVGLLLSIGMITTLILEIPTGAFADLYGKKRSVLIASLFSLIGIGCLAVGSSFPVFALGLASWGISTAFSSGAGNAWLYDSLKAIGQEKSLTKHLGRLSAMFISVDILSSILAPLLFAYNVRVPYFVSLIAIVIVIIIQFSMFEKVTKSIDSGWKMIKENTLLMKESFQSIIGNRFFLLITLVGMMFFVANKAVSEIVSGPYLTTIAGYSVPTLSIILAGASVIQTIAVFFSDKIEHFLGLRKSLLSLLFLFPAMIFAYSTVKENYLLTTLIVGLYFSLVSFSEVVFESNLSHTLPDSKRATMLSINSMIIKLFAVILLPLFGTFVDKYSIQQGLWLLSGTVLVIGFFISVLHINKVSDK